MNQAARPSWLQSRLIKKKVEPCFMSNHDYHVSTDKRRCQPSQLGSAWELSAQCNSSYMVTCKFKRALHIWYLFSATSTSQGWRTGQAVSQEQILLFVLTDSKYGGWEFPVRIHLPTTQHAAHNSPLIPTYVLCYGWSQYCWNVLYLVCKDAVCIQKAATTLHLRYPGLCTAWALQKPWRAHHRISKELMKCPTE